MLIIGATENQIREALTLAGKYYANNLKFSRLNPNGHTRDGKPKFLVTIRCISSKAPGHRLAPHYLMFGGARGIPNRLIHACWHAHGTFFDHLPEGTIIQTAWANYMVNERWHDYNIGSIMYPVMASEACEC